MESSQPYVIAQRDRAGIYLTACVAWAEQQITQVLVQAYFHVAGDFPAFADLLDAAGFAEPGERQAHVDITEVIHLGIGGNAELFAVTISGQLL